MAQGLASIMPVNTGRQGPGDIFYHVKVMLNKIEVERI
jgi:hypothetical protein